MVRNTLRTAVIAVVSVLTGCAGLPRHVQKTPSVAFQQPETTTLGRIVAADEIGKNLSGFRLLSSGEAALASLITLADHAERTLDIQYYIIHEDESTQEFLHHVRLAADRGVRVRLLVDDLNTAGEDRRFMHLSSPRECRGSRLQPLYRRKILDLDALHRVRDRYTAHQSPDA